MKVPVISEIPRRTLRYFHYPSRFISTDWYVVVIVSRFAYVFVFLSVSYPNHECTFSQIEVLYRAQRWAQFYITEYCVCEIHSGDDFNLFSEVRDVINTFWYLTYTFLIPPLYLANSLQGMETSFFRISLDFWTFVSTENTNTSVYLRRGKIFRTVLEVNESL